MRRKKDSLVFSEKKKVLTPGLIKEILSWVFYTIIAVFIASMLVIAFGMKTTVIGESMEPTIYNGQTVFINRVAYLVSSPKKDDVIAFLPNGNSNSHYYIKRVMGVPGDTIQIIDGILYINGEEQSIDDTIYDKMEEAGIAENEIKLTSGQYFVLGDNRNSSEDSRSANIGLVKGTNILGKCWYKTGGTEGDSGFVN
ncbi:MAG: signal peptidase I [Butyrivibrio sp.]|nr:signal peptidase I [Butyrivibrio sp.]